ncbi:hypothetical protein GOHSU_19_00460 [Gordonia hirsuta DSM 44140 = NBRC 16056]|uniref:DUF1023 domain-containing protein n=1 Tax=Gordonia hirsuta DSM 44140 = NBRC 16056 TaxID=1121927 RepID=L7L9M0_9ACTN|nr:alpha/beta hydrolase [Gordonia hirsuta]GAC57441.1 hypothetical protein GOHSU_19_00460 [Gordonia hirsuta DSM 44140 = NBRC 16056]
MTGIAAVQAWPLDQLGAAVLALSTGAGEFRNIAAQVSGSLSRHPDWVGATHDAVQRRISVHDALARRLANTIEAAAGTGRMAWEALVPTRALLLQLVETATLSGFVVADDGTVTPPAANRAADAGYLSHRITTVLGQLINQDQTLGLQLQQLSALLRGDLSVLPHPDGGWAEPRTLIARLQKLDQRAVREFWEALTPGEVAALIDADPETIGNLYGVAFDDRIEANRRAITNALAREVAAGRGGRPRARELRAMLAPAPGIDGKPAPRRFVAFSSIGRGRYIEQIGDLHPGIEGVGVLVPGTGSRLDNASDQRRRALGLARSAGAPIFVFNDGTLPQRIAPPLARLADPGAYRGTAIDAEPARLLGRRLADFGLDLDAEVAYRAPGTPTTYIGHSYGGSVVGTAEQYGLRADRIVFASSAGTGAAGGPPANPNPDVQRFSLTAPGDPIQLAQQHGGAVHGGDPDSTPGIQRLDTGWYSNDGRHPGKLISGPDGHAAYLDDPRSTAMRNIADVIAGRSPTGYVWRAPDHAKTDTGLDYLLDALRGPLAQLPR